MPLVIERPLEDLSPNNSLIHQPTKCAVPLYDCHQVGVGLVLFVVIAGITIESCRISFVQSFSFPRGIGTEPVKTVKYSESTHYVSFRAIANDSVVSHASPRVVSQSLRDFHIFFLLFFLFLSKVRSFHLSPTCISMQLLRLRDSQRFKRRPHDEDLAGH